MITRIRLSGYKSIKNMDLDLRPINILLGGNGVGKSNLISIFTFIHHILNKNLQAYVQKNGFADAFLHFGKKNTKEIQLELEFTDERGNQNKFIQVLSVAQDTLMIKSTKTAFYTENKWYPVEFEKNKLESGFTSIKEKRAYYVNERLKEFDVFHFHDTSDNSPIKSPSDINDNKRLKRDGANLASILYLMKEKHPKHFVRVEKTVQSIAPFFEKFVLEPMRLNENMVRLEWREKGFPDLEFNAYHLSDGTLRFICLAALLMQPNPPKTIIIDEPELGLHPVAINKVAGMVRKVSENTQIILSTQSASIIDNFDPEDIIVTDRGKEGSIFRRLDSLELQNWLDEYTLGDLWGQNKIGVQPFSV